MKRILGLDLGTNSIGWALVENNFNKKVEDGKIIGMGSRIIPMDAKQMGAFDSGQSISATANRTQARGMRRLYERSKLRRERLHRVLNILGFLPKHYAKEIDFEKRLGQFKKGTEPKLAYKKNDNGKHEFIFQGSFNEMVDEFKAHGQDIKLPYDWTLYYLRKKALTKKISKEELSWILLNFNQKRGYYQSRDEEDKFEESKNKEYVVLKVDKLQDSGQEVKGKKLYDVYFENGWLYSKQITKTEDWIDKTKEFIVTTKKLKDGNIKRTFKQVKPEDWIAIKNKTEDKIKKSNDTVGKYVYQSLLSNPTQKIRGELVKTIERKFYKEELDAILDTQLNHHPELQDKELYEKAINELYRYNESHKNNIRDKGFKYLFMEDILFYHRPLKSQKSSISNCPFEQRVYVKDSEKHFQPLKVIHKSHPVYQEFRLWQFIHNLKIYERESTIDGKVEINLDVTSKYLVEESDYVALYEFLDNRKEINQKALLKFFELNDKSHRWNYVEDKNYPANTLKAEIHDKLKDIPNIDADAFMTKDFIFNLFHIIYSVTDRNQFSSALKTFARKNNLPKDEFQEAFIKMNFENSYGGFSEKAIKKLLPLMRRGKYSDDEAISKDTKERIASILNRLESIDFDVGKIESVADDDIPKQILKTFASAENAYCGLNTYQASYAVYGRHSEASEIIRWSKPEDISEYLDNFKQHSLRNPIVEQLVTETLRVVRDIWDYYGNGQENYFDEIHVELGREMKNSADVRKKITDAINRNTNTNERIKNTLRELMNDKSVNGEINPFSKGHQEILKLFEEGVDARGAEKYNDISKDDIDAIKRKQNPTKSEINKYKLWLEQGYISPYTGEVIPLSKLFTSDYEVEHIIPRSRYFDDSMSNKVICEATINPYPYKGNKTAYGFIQDQGGSIIKDKDRIYSIFKKEDYEEHCKTFFKHNKKKLKLLLSEDIPEGFIERQLNDSRYISKVVKGLLSNVVREEGEQEATSKHLIPVTGAVTSELKADWGLNDVWDDLLAPRFERMNKLTKTQDFRFEVEDREGNKKMVYTVPDEHANGFTKKRLDHRHHAMDALVIACATKDHTNLLNNKHANSKNERYDLKRKLRELEVKTVTDKKTGGTRKVNKWKKFYKPWSNFTKDAKDALETTIVSFKQNKRVLTKATNKFLSYKNEDGSLRLDANGKPKKDLRKQLGKNRSVRKAMHDPMPYGEVSVQFDVLDIHKNIGKREHVMDQSIKEELNRLFNANNENIGQTQKQVKAEPIKNRYGFKVDKARFEIKNKKYSKRQPMEKISASSLNKLLDSIENNGIEDEKTQVILNKCIEETQKMIWKVQDLQLQKDLEEHMYTNIIQGKYNIAFFSQEGIDKFNIDRESRKRLPVYNLRFVESGEKRFDLGESYFTRHKKVEATDGTNLFFNVYFDDENEKRVFETVSLKELILHQKWRGKLSENERKNIPMAPIDNSKGRFMFSLSPEDLVYVPSEDEVENPKLVNFNNLDNKQRERVYRVNDFSTAIYFSPNSHSKAIAPKEVDLGINPKNGKQSGSYDDKTATLDGKQIKDICWKLKVDRLGNLKHIG